MNSTKSVQANLPAYGTGLNRMPVYIHTHRIISAIDGCNFLLKHQSQYRMPSQAIENILSILGDSISSHLSEREICMIGSRLEHVCSEHALDSDLSEYRDRDLSSEEAREDIYFDLMNDWTIREELLF